MDDNEAAKDPHYRERCFELLPELNVLDLKDKDGNVVEIDSEEDDENAEDEDSELDDLDEEDDEDDVEDELDGDEDDEDEDEEEENADKHQPVVVKAGK